MSRLRPTLFPSISDCEFVNNSAPKGQKIKRKAALEAVYRAVARRRSLAFGVIKDDRSGKTCAMGCFWADHPESSFPTSLVDEIAAVNDSVPASATPKERWQTVISWLRTQLSLTED